MGNFLRENWIWIVAPVVLVLILVVVLMVWGGGDDASPFAYSIY